MDLAPLYQTLNQRQRPEDVAQILLPLLREHLPPLQFLQLSKVAAGSLLRNAWGFSAMQGEFKQPVGAAKQAQRAGELFGHPKLGAAAEAEATEPDFSDPEQVAKLLQDLNSRIGKTVEGNNYLTDRLDRAARENAGLGGLSRRRYNKLFRVLRHLAAKRERLVRAIRQRSLQLVGKHGFAHEISPEEFASDLFSAAFIAYYTARCNLRSEFTISGQQRPYDEIADLLFRHCGGATPRQSAVARWLGPSTSPAPPPATTNWWAIAHVYPQPEVLGHLTDEQKGQLLGRWTGLLNELAELLRDTWAANTFRRESMVVKRGDDSST